MILREITCIRFGKAGAHPQLALGIAIAPKTLSFITTSQFKRLLRFFRFSLRFLLRFIVQFCYLLRKCGLLAHTSAAFLKNCCTEKLFSCLRLVFCTLFKTKASGENLPPDAFSIGRYFLKITAYFALVSTSSFSFASKSSSCMLPKSPFFLERTATVFCSTSLSPMVIIYGTFSSTACRIL